MTQCAAMWLWVIAGVASVIAIILFVGLANEITINTSLRAMGHKISVLAGLRRRFVTTLVYFILFSIGTVLLANTKTTPCGKKLTINKPCKCKGLYARN